MNSRPFTTAWVFFATALAAFSCFAADSAYVRPTAEEALAYLKSLPPIVKKIDGKKTAVHFWADKTPEFIRTVKEIAPGGHVADGSHLDIQPSDWKYFTAFSSLEVAKLYELGGVTDEALSHLGHLSPTVKYLFVETANLSDAGVKHLHPLKDLEFLGIGWTTNITDGALQHMAEMANLQEILVSGCKEIKGPGVSHLARLKKLRALRIAGTSVSDASLSAFRDLTVEELTLAQNNVTAAGIKGLLTNAKFLPNLKKLDLKKTGVTAAEAAELMKLRPGLVIDV